MILSIIWNVCAVIGAIDLGLIIAFVVFWCWPRGPVPREAERPISIRTLVDHDSRALREAEAILREAGR